MSICTFFPKTRGFCVSIFRWLASKSNFRGHAEKGSTIHMLSVPKFGFLNKWEQILIDPFTECSIYWSTSQFQKSKGLPSGGKIPADKMNHSIFTSMSISEIKVLFIINGLMASSIYVMPYAILRMKPLQNWLAKSYRLAAEIMELTLIIARKIQRFVWC